MIMQLRQLFGTAPASGRISAPAALLVLGVALSCSTACITSAVVQTAQEGIRNNRADQAKHAAQVRLQENIQAQSKDAPKAVLTGDPESLAGALRLALPSGRPGQPASGLVEVNLMTSGHEQPIYSIIIQGDFDFWYWDAFVAYANSLRLKLDPRAVFHLKLTHTVNGSSSTVWDRVLK